MENICVVTGASSGIGYNITLRLLDSGKNVIGIGNSNMPNLMELENKYPLQFKAIQCDLSELESNSAIQKICDCKKIELLVLGAGYANYGAFENSSADGNMALLNVDLLSPVVLTKLLLKSMADNSNLVFISSFAACLPGCENLALYYASKAFLKSFGFSLNEELKPRGICVKVICADYTDTNFGRQIGFKPGLGLKPEYVAEEILKALNKKKTCHIIGRLAKFEAFLAHFFPEDVIIKVVGAMMKKLSAF